MQITGMGAAQMSTSSTWWQQVQPQSQTRVGECECEQGWANARGRAGEHEPEWADKNGRTGAGEWGGGTGGGK